MKPLELKIPPPLVTLACAALAWGLSAPGLGWRLPAGSRLVGAGMCLLLGAALTLWALGLFRRARTTASPLQPGRSRALVREGPYRFTRNPMYLGLALLLLALCLWLGDVLALLALVVFVAWITRFQILPEERALQERFGPAYAQYRQEVRRWL